MEKLVIAIDGPAGAGKSTVARMLAEKLGYIYIDTGAMYRAVTWAVMERQIAIQDRDQVGDLARSIHLNLQYINQKTQVTVDGIDVTETIRNPEVSRLVSEVSAIPQVREAMVFQQRQLASGGGVVLDGRDVGSHVIPDAQVKIFLTASIEERVNRRWQELQVKGYPVELAVLTTDMNKRDQMDYERETSPLIQAADAVLIDTSGLTIQAVLEKIMEICEAKNNGL